MLYAGRPWLSPAQAVGLDMRRHAPCYGLGQASSSPKLTKRQASRLRKARRGVFTGKIAFIHTDVGDEASVQHLYHETLKRFGKVDAIINNATIAVLGQVKDLPIEKWDISYRVNLRGPVLLARAFLPDMIARSHGVFVCVSSTGTAYLGGYETFKAAQVHLANTLDAELDGTGVIAYTIGPGLVPTETASQAVAKLAPLMGMNVEELYALNENVVLTPEEAGAGFAVSIVFAERFKGMEISSSRHSRRQISTTGARATGKQPAQSMLLAGRKPPSYALKCAWR